ncbi:MAG TPA: hypothetical protein VK348_13025 [Planctomycetota bacterium]|nr:hypothetical protein [Planctomycetota bacterium]
MKTLTTKVLALAMAGASLPAQRLPLPDHSGRVLQLIDLLPLLGSAGNVAADQPTAPAAAPAAPADVVIAAAPAGAPAAADAAAPTNEMTAIAAFVRNFVQPPLRPGDDIQVLGDHWLAVLATPQQAASAEQLIATALRSRLDLVCTVARIVELTPEVFAKHLQPLLPAVAADRASGVQQTILEGKAAGELLQALQQAQVNLMEAPTLTSFPLYPCHLSTGQQIAYIKDYNLETTPDAVVADPVIGIIWDGVHIDLVASYTGQDRVGLQCTLEKQDVVKPIAEFKTTLPGCAQPVTIQLPRSTGVRLQQTAELPLGSTVLIAARKTDGGWLAALIEVRRERH